MSQQSVDNRTSSCAAAVFSASTAGNNNVYHKNLIDQEIGNNMALTTLVNKGPSEALVSTMELRDLGLKATLAINSPISNPTASGPDRFQGEQMQDNQQVWWLATTPKSTTQWLTKTERSTTSMDRPTCLTGTR